MLILLFFYPTKLVLSLHFHPKQLPAAYGPSLAIVAATAQRAGLVVAYNHAEGQHILGAYLEHIPKLMSNFRNPHYICPYTNHTLNTTQS